MKFVDLSRARAARWVVALSLVVFFGATLVRAQADEDPSKAKKPALAKGSPWTADDVIAALERGVAEADLVEILQSKVDGTAIDTTGYRRIMISEPGRVYGDGKRSYDMDGLNMTLINATQPRSAATDRLAAEAIARRRAELGINPVAPVDSPELRARYAKGDPEAAYTLYLVISDRMARQSRGQWPVDEPSWAELTAKATAFGYRPAQWMAQFPGYHPDGSPEKDPIKLYYAYRTSAEAGDPMGAFYLSKVFGNVGGSTGATLNFATTEYWLIEAGARAWPGLLERPFLNAQLALSNLYIGRLPHTGLDLPSYDTASYRWLREALGRGGVFAENASLLLQFHHLFARSWGSHVNVEAKLKAVPAEVPAIPAASLAAWDAAVLEGDMEAAMKLHAAYSNGRGVRQDDLKAVEILMKAAENDPSIQVLRALAEHHKTGFGAALDDTQRLLWLQQAADLGDADAWMQVGRLYRTESRNPGAVTPDMAKALHAYEQAMALGHVEAAREVGSMYANGQGVEKDLAQARVWFQRGADGGDADAMLELAKSFASWPMPYEEWDYVSAERWYVKAAEAGAKGAYARLAESYAGLGVPYSERDHVKATMWYRKAVESGDAAARINLAWALHYSDRKEEARDLFLKLAQEGDVEAQAQIATLLEWDNRREQAAAWYRKVAANGAARETLRTAATKFVTEFDEERSAPVGSLFYVRGQAKDGDNDARVKYAQMIAASDRVDALRWLRLAASDKHPAATMMFYVETKKEDPTLATEWLDQWVKDGNPQALLISGLELAATDRAAGQALVQQAMEAGNLEAKYRIALMKYQGNGLPQDMAGGVTLLTEAADAGYPAAQFDIGRALVGGSPGVIADPQRGIAYLEKAASQNVPQACGMLGEIFERGMGGAPDLRAALEWYQRAQQLGLAAAGPAAQRVEQQMRTQRVK